MKRIRSYFEKNVFVYVVSSEYVASSEYALGDLIYRIYRFESLESALEWINTEEYDGNSLNK